MSDIVMRVDHVSKQYRIGARQNRHRTFREALVSAAAAPFQWIPRWRAPGWRAPHETIWALQDVSFDVRAGEVVGVIGRNGAGKSTLLKILSRITEPTSGYADITGRVGALLEVGTGFHLELTGRENIYLNAAILGMKRREVDAKLDEIVAFAEVGTFLDTPVKHYSTGMHLRLAFSVAAHLEPDILLVDEVLAVGDASFQKKCIGKMEDVAAQGRTVVFVSHNLGVVRELCESCVLMDRGRVTFRGSVLHGLARYSDAVRQAPSLDIASGVGWRGVAIGGAGGGAHRSLTSGEPLTIDGWLALGEEFSGGAIICIIEDSVGNTIVHNRSKAADLWHGTLEPGLLRVTVEFPVLWLSPGAYTAYFKFLGMAASGADARAVSERTLLDVTGSRAGVSRAILTPRPSWSLRTDATVAVTSAEAVGHDV